MAHDETLTQRVREALAHLENVQEKKMFRGITFMVNGKMCFSTGGQKLMCRIDPAMHDELIQTMQCEVMTMKNKEYRGYLYVHTDNLKTSKAFKYWIGLALDYNQTLQRDSLQAKKKQRTT